MFFGGTTDSGGSELSLLHGGEHRHAKDRTSRKGGPGGLGGPGNHLRSTRGVQGQERAGATLEALNRRCDRVGNVMKLEIEKDFETERMKFVDDTRPMAREELKSEFHPSELTGERASERQGLLLGLYVKGENKAARVSHSVFMETAGLYRQRKGAARAYFFAAFLGVGVLGREDIEN